MVSHCRGWGPIVVLPAAAALLIPAGAPSWVLMWGLAFSIFLGCKWLTWRRSPTGGAPAWLHVGYFLLWPGLDAPAFLGYRPSRPVPVPAKSEWARGTVNVLAGAGLFWGSREVVPPGHDLMLGWCGMVGLVLMLHFGSFHLLSCAWRAIGVNALPLMDRPLASTSVSEFWGRRWNTAFRDLAHRFLFRPLTTRAGPRAAVVGGFLFSGIVHDVVISFPAHGGYGLPTLFFVMQAGALLAERSRFGRRYGLGRGWRGWVFGAVVLAGPAFGLFHPWFVLGIIIPFMRALGAA